MYHSAVLPPQVDRLTCANTSTHWHSQAPDEPTRAPFATQSATHLILQMNYPDKVVDIQFDDRVAMRSRSQPAVTSANRLRSAPGAVQGWLIDATHPVLGRCKQAEPRRSLWRLMTPVPDTEAPRRDLVDSPTDFAWLVTQLRPDSYPTATAGRRTPQTRGTLARTTALMTTRGALSSRLRAGWMRAAGCRRRPRSCCGS